MFYAVVVFKITGYSYYLQMEFKRSAVRSRFSPPSLISSRATCDVFAGGSFFANLFCLIFAAYLQLICVAGKFCAIISGIIFCIRSGSDYKELLMYCFSYYRAKGMLKVIISQSTAIFDIIKANTCT